MRWVLKVLVLRVLMVLMVLSVSIVAQTPAPPPGARDGVITGQVVDGLTGKPISAAIVFLAGAGVSLPGGQSEGFRVQSEVPRILTGGDGRFVLRGLPTGSFTVRVTKGGYAEGASGRRRSGGASQPIVLSQTQRTADVVIRIWKNAAIGGTVTDEAGEPVVGLQVRALVRTTTGGRRRFMPSGAASFTDDRGVYRFSNLVPGEYMVMASPPPISARLSVFRDIARSGRGVGELAVAMGPGGTQLGLQVGDTLLTLGRGSAIPPAPTGDRVHIYPTTFHPAAVLPSQASIVTIGSGEERLGIDVQLQPARTARLSGTALSAAGPAGITALRLALQAGDEIPSELLGGVTFTDSTGGFTFPAVPPGRYVLRASGSVGPIGSSPGSNLFWLDTPVTVSGDDIDGLVLMLRPGLRVSGRVEFEGSTLKPPAEGSGRAVPIALEPADGVPTSPQAPNPSALAWTAEGFTLAGFRGGSYLVRVTNSPAGWMFKSATLDGRDVSETPLDLHRDVTGLVITFTDRWSGLSGSIQGAGADGAVVLVFPTDAQAWTNYGTTARRLKSTRPNAQGRFGLSSLPPGDYYIVAIPDEHSSDWTDPKTLDALARLASQVSIGEGEHRTIDLRVREVGR